jgi:hypothetical protein
VVVLSYCMESLCAFGSRQRLSRCVSYPLVVRRQQAVVGTIHLIYSCVIDGANKTNLFKYTME